MACIIVAVLAPRAAAQVAAAALVEPAVSQPAPASPSTKVSHLATVKRAAARNGDTQVRSSMPTL